MELDINYKYKPIECWLKKFDMTAEERDFLRTATNVSNDVSSTAKRCVISDSTRHKFLSMISHGDVNELKDYNLSIFRSGATYVIDKLFEDNVDDDTLVLTTGSEHPSVTNNLAKCKNVVKVIALNYLVCDIQALITKIITEKKIKKVFIYMIALSMGDSMYQSNDVTMHIMHLLDAAKLPYVTVIDAVQEMFFLYRDYSMYDYVISTAHATVRLLNFGIMLSKNSVKQYKSFYDIEDIEQFLKAHSIYEKNMKQMLLFHSMMYQVFAKYIQSDRNISVCSNYTPLFFIINDKKNRLQGIQQMDTLAQVPQYTQVIFRPIELLCKPIDFIKKIDKTLYMLDNQ